MLSQAVCNHCGAANRIPAGKPAASARCGKCKANLTLSEPVDVDDAQLARHLRATHGPVLLDVWAPWCGPCRSMAPQFKAAATALCGEARLLKINSDSNRTPSEMGVSGIPALILFSEGREIARRAGLVRANELVAWVRSQSALSQREAAS